jgi:hypothetical protein
MKPYHGWPYLVPHKHKAVLMKEIKWLCNIGVLEWQPSSQWASSTINILKKDSTVHTISDFRELNKRIVREPYPIPKIITILQELEGFTYATALDLNMGYYTIRLDPTASKMCTIIFPWGKYSYKRLPMGFLAGNVGMCVCQLHPPNDRHLYLSPTCQKCWSDMLGTFCYVGFFFRRQSRVWGDYRRHSLLQGRRNQY